MEREINGITPDEDTTAGAGLRLHAVSRRFGDTLAVDDVSLDVGPEDFLVLLGPSGCGKTTLLRMIAGLLEPTDGAITLGGRDITGLPPRDRDLAMVFQSYALYPHLTVARNIGFGLRARRRPKAEIAARVQEAAGLLDLERLLDRRPRELSGGQRQRVALGRAIVRDPAAFLMDEPLSNLDANLRTQTRTEIAELHRRLRRTFVYVTHDQVEAMTMATHVALLQGGRLEQVGSPVEVYDRPATTFVAGFLGSPPMNLLDVQLVADDGLLCARAAGVDVVVRAGAAPLRDAVLGVRPEHLEIVEAGAGAPISAVVRMVENLGGEELAHCDVGASRLVVRGPRPLRVRPGQALGLRADPTHLHLFDATSGRRLEWREAATPQPALAG
jgi:multiple sugar transport system ATP-binding protein